MRSRRYRAARRKREQVTCLCLAYPFPHRCGGGRCSGSDWAKSYLENEHSECKGCLNLINLVECEVSNGQEPIKYCPGYREHFRMQPSIRHPGGEDNLRSGYVPDDMDEYYMSNRNDNNNVPSPIRSWNDDR